MVMFIGPDARGHPLIEVVIVIWWGGELAIARARESHLSWRELGDAIGTSGEAVRQRYSA